MFYDLRERIMPLPVAGHYRRIGRLHRFAPKYVPRAGGKAEPGDKANDDRRSGRRDRRRKPGDTPGTIH